MLDKAGPLNQFLTLTQSSWPIDHDPYLVISQVLEISRDAAYALMNEARAAGLIRRIGPVFDSYKLGYVSTLGAVKVPERRLEAVTAIINSYTSVTHNYLRANAFNIWFTVIAWGDQELQRVIAEIADKTGLAILQLPALKLFKIRVDFNLSDQKRAAYPSSTITPTLVTPQSFSPTDQQIIRILQENSFEGYYPYERLAKDISAALGRPFSEAALLATLREWKDRGVIRRFGVTLSHQNVGLTANVMVVWDIPDAMSETAGCIMAKQEAVSHCYERSRYPDWPVNLYTMIHGRTLEDILTVIQHIRSALTQAGITVQEPQLLPTQRELKKTAMKYFSEPAGSEPDKSTREPA